jgi:hypothetical protein
MNISGSVQKKGLFSVSLLQNVNSSYVFCAVTVQEA